MVETQEQEEQKSSKMQLAVKDEDWHLVGLPPPGAIKALKIFCREMLDTPFLPASLIKNAKSDDQLVGILLSVCLSGKEMGLSPMQSLRSFWLSPDGRLGMYADAMMARMLSVGAQFKWVKNDREGAILEATRGDNSYRAEFTVEDAKAAGLWTKDRSPWPKYPRQMCESRVKGMMFRSLFADLGGTAMYSKEELQDMDDEPINITPREEAEREADKAAEADPKLRLKKKDKVAPAPQTVDVKAEEVQPEPAKPATPEVTDEDVPLETPKPETKKPKTDGEIFNERKAAVLAKVPGTDAGHIKLYFLGYLGHPAPKSPEPYFAALDKLEQTIKYDIGAKKFVEKPEELGKFLKDARIEEIIGAEPEPAENNLPEDEPWDDEPEPDAKQPEPEPEPVKPAKQTKKAAETPKPVPGDSFEEKYNWSAETCSIARRAMKSRNLDEAKLDKFYSTFGLKDLSDEEAGLIWLMYSFSANAMLLKRSADEKKMPVREVYAMVNKHFGQSLTATSGDDPIDAARAIDNALTEIQTM